jgi:hypothetical protein
LRAAISGFIPVERDQDAFGTPGLERGQDLIRYSMHAKAELAKRR